MLMHTKIAGFLIRYKRPPAHNFILLTWRLILKGRIYELLNYLSLNLCICRYIAPTKFVRPKSSDAIWMLFWRQEPNATALLRKLYMQ